MGFGNGIRGVWSISHSRTITGQVCELYFGQMRPPMLPDDYQYHLERVRQSLLTRKPGRFWARASLICGVWSLFIAPGVLGPLGVTAGMVAIAKGDKWWGAAGVSVSAVAAVIGYY